MRGRAYLPQPDLSILQSEAGQAVPQLRHAVHTTGKQGYLGLCSGREAMLSWVTAFSVLLRLVGVFVCCSPRHFAVFCHDKKLFLTHRCLLL